MVRRASSIKRRPRYPQHTTAGSGTKRADPASLYLGPGLSFADETAERAALQLQRVAARECQIARIGLAVLGVVDLSAPLVGAGRLHAEHDLHADQRTAAL